MRKAAVGFLDAEAFDSRWGRRTGEGSVGTRRRSLRLETEKEADMSDPHPIPTPTPDTPPILPPDPTFPPRPIEEPDPDLLPDELPNPNPDENIEPPKHAGVELRGPAALREPSRTAGA
jgi:hypothetical protein